MRPKSSSTHGRQDDLTEYRIDRDTGHLKGSEAKGREKRGKGLLRRTVKVRDGRRASGVIRDDDLLRLGFAKMTAK